jgi:plastocyanin
VTGKRRALAAAAGGLAVLLSACGGGSEKASGAQVTLRLIAFRPASVSVSRRETVTWTNKDAATHTVTSEAFDSGELGTGNTFSHRFVKAGTFAYFCKIHSATMRGEITVA